MASEEIPSTPPTNLASISDFVARLAAHMRANELTLIDIEIPEARIRLRGGHARAVESGPGKKLPLFEESEVRVDGVSHGDVQSDDLFIEAPMIGTFYAGPGPGEPFFVEVGDTIEIGQTIAIIEAMKIMNEIVADRRGTIVEILVQNADAVEYGQPLFRLKTDDA